MKTLIVFATKYGCTADCAALLKEKLKGEIILADIATTTPNPADYDTVIIGGSVYVGKINKKLRAFCEKNLATLTQKKLGIFLCAAQPEEYEKNLAGNFPAELLNHAKTKKHFGSDVRLEKMGFIDKAMIKAVTNGDFSNFKIYKDAIADFVAEIKK